MDVIEELRKKAIKIYEALTLNEGLSWGGDLMEMAGRSCRQLEKFQYNIGMIGAQSSGKTTILNTLLGYPYLPAAQIDTTAAALHVKYRETLGIEVQDGNGNLAVINLQKIKVSDFLDLKKYACLCMKEYGIEHLSYFIAESGQDEQGNMVVKPENLKLEYVNYKHRAILVLNLLLLYVDVKKIPEYLNQEILDIIRLREKLLSLVGLSAETQPYSVTFYCDSPVLQGGVMFTDLPGLGSDGEFCLEGQQTNEQTALEEMKKVDAMMLIMTPTMSAQDRETVRAAISAFAECDVADVESRVIPVVNKIDLSQGGYQNKTEQVFAECGLELKKGDVIRVSALWAEGRLFGLHGELLLDKSKAAHALPGFCRNTEQVKSLLEENYKKSGFARLYRSVCDRSARMLAEQTLQLMLLCREKQELMCRVLAEYLDDFYDD